MISVISEKLANELIIAPKNKLSKILPGTMVPYGIHKYETNKENLVCSL